MVTYVSPIHTNDVCFLESLRKLNPCMQIAEASDSDVSLLIVVSMRRCMADYLEIISERTEDQWWLES